MSTAPVKILVGDCRQILKRLPDESIHCCVTSPPYFGLRDYGVAGQIGLEQTPENYVTELVEVFSEIRRVLKKDGTVWLNLGDSYASYRDGKATPDSTRKGSTGTLVPKGKAANRMAASFAGSTIKHKDLIGIPWRVAFALQASGWYLRQDIIWHKPNPMPESVKDRCTKAHEYIFLLSKSPKYYYDADAVKEEANPENHRVSAGVRRTPPGSSAHGGPANGKRDYEFKNKRSVWTVTPKPYKEAHFAVYPPELIEPCILAGCPEGGVVLDPFGGSGTTGEVASKNGRRSILIELNAVYAELAKKRTGGDVICLS